MCRLSDYKVLLLKFDLRVSQEKPNSSVSESMPQAFLALWVFSRSELNNYNLQSNSIIHFTAPACVVTSKACSCFRCSTGNIPNNFAARFFLP
jgi:hypothetical protein